MDVGSGGHRRIQQRVFFVAIFATPFFGLLADRFGHRALMLIFGTLLLPVTFVVLGPTSLSLWVSTVMSAFGDVREFFCGYAVPWFHIPMTAREYTARAAEISIAQRSFS
ncbi:MAG TPA: MFS transporter [Steroidobacteraceae bacterium]